MTTGGREGVWRAAAAGGKASQHLEPVCGPWGGHEEGSRRCRPWAWPRTHVFLTRNCNQGTRSGGSKKSWRETRP